MANTKTTFHIVLKGNSTDLTNVGHVHEEHDSVCVFVALWECIEESLHYKLETWNLKDVERLLGKEATN